MNFLGHLFLSNNDKKLMLHNLYGDFVKGKDLSFYPPEVQKGIVLHRQIDDFIDHHTEVVELVHSIHSELPKVSGIAVDLIFDHLLAKHWNTHHPLDLNEYLRSFYSSVDTSPAYFSAEFKFVMEKLISMNWISYYPRLEGLQKASSGVSGRISFPNELGKTPDVFLKHEMRFEQVFESYMKDAILKFKVDNWK